MHICFISNEYPRKGHYHGGIGSFLKTIAPSLVQMGHEVTIIGTTENERQVIEWDGQIRLIRTLSSKIKGIAWWINFRFLNQALEQLHKNSPIHIIEGSELSFSFIKKIKGVKYVIRLHGGHHFFAEGENRKIKIWKGFQEKKSFDNADAFIAVSKYVKSHTSKYLSFQEKKVEVIYNPVMIYTFEKENFPAIKKDHLVFVGTICEKKGIRQLIQALPIVQKANEGIHLDVYGRDWKFPNGKSYLEWMKSQFDDKTLSMVSFHGPINQVQLAKVYSEAELCVFPSHTETLGLVAPEAMVMSKPVIFTELGPGPEIIKHGEEGWLCDPHNPEDIAAKINDALANRESFERIGMAARQKVLNTFNPDHLIKENIAFYQSVLN